MTARARHIIPACLIAGLAVLTGCTHDSNDRLTLGDAADDSSQSVSLEAISPSPPLEPAAGPSINSVDRTAWEPVTILSPAEDVSHCPHLTQLQPQYSSTPERRQGIEPTAESALTMDANHNAVAEVLAAPFWAGWDVLLFIPRAIVPDLRSHDSTYQRAPQPALRAETAPLDSSGQPAS